MRSFPWLPFFVFAAGASACTESSGESAASADSFVSDGEGILVVGAHPALLKERVDVELDDRPIVLGEQQVVQLGMHRVAVNGLVDQVEVRAGAPVKYWLDAVIIRAPSTPTLGLNAPLAGAGDFPNELRVTVSGLEGSATVDPTKGNPEHLNQQLLVIPHARGFTMQSSWGAGASLLTNLAIEPSLRDEDAPDDLSMGAAVSIVNFDEWRPAFTLVAPPIRKYPGPEVWSVKATTSGKRAEVVMAPGSSLEIDLTNRMEVDGPGLHIDLQKWAETGSLSVALARLDVDDIEITSPDGSTTQVVSGQYVLESPSHTYDGRPTKTGMDVLPGTYTLITHYEDPWRGDVVTRKELMLPSPPPSP